MQRKETKAGNALNAKAQKPEIMAHTGVVTDATASGRKT